MDTQDFWDLSRAFFAVVIVLTSVTGLWRLRNWYVRTNRYEPPAAYVVSAKLSSLNLCTSPLHETCTKGLCSFLHLDV